ncbi:MAG: hypothetical protein ACXABY_18500 [Candidatus Thorarchaeota archaeon]
MNSTGCVDFGNNNFYEVMRDERGVIEFICHDDGPDGVPISWNEFITGVPECYRPDVLRQLADLLDKFK